MYEIEKGITLPHRYNLTYPFAKMKLWDSFFIAADENMDKLQQRLLRRARRYRIDNRNAFKICTRKVDNGIRVWRVK